MTRRSQGSKTRRKKLVDSGAQPFETMILAEGRPELTAPGPSTVPYQTND